LDAASIGCGSVYRCVMPTHPLWQPYAVPTDAEIAAARVQPAPAERVEVVAPDPGRAAAFERVREQIGAALGARALAITHVGSTSVPGLAAKPVIDVDLIVADARDEAPYLPALESAGFVLRIREPEWHEHRLVRGAEPVANVHIWSPDCPEPARHRMFRDWLRADDDDRRAYGKLKLALAHQGFEDVMHYNNAKSALIHDIYERAFAADPAHRHDPQPR